jgi:DNA-binding XRE family transcriptional regulator
MLAQASQQGAEMALRSMREDAKLARQDAGRASEKLGQLLRQHRQHTQLTQVQLSRLARVHPTTVGKIEASERGMSLVTFCRIADAFSGKGNLRFTWDVIEEVNSWA